MAQKRSRSRANPAGSPRTHELFEMLLQLGVPLHLREHLARAQMEAGRLHPSRNLERPIDPDFAWVGAESVEHRIECALNMSMGFGGINTAVCLQRA